MVNPEVREEVPDEQVAPAELVTENYESRDSNGQTDIAQEDQLGIPGFVQWAGGVEMVNTAEPAVLLALSATLALAFVVVVSGNVGHQVVGPADELLSEEVDEGDDRRLLTELTKFVG